jgi:flavin-dependent dehydrogenase
LEGIAVREIDERPDAVTVRGRDSSWSASVVIGADGVNSVVSRMLPGHGERLVGLAYEGEATSTDPVLDQDVLFDFRKFPGGYGWIFPKRDHYSVGGYAEDGDARNVARLYDEFCAEMPQLTSCRTYRRRGYLIPHGGIPRKLNTGRLLLVGDAAGLVDPLTGEGIYYALRSGQLGAEAAEAFLSRSASLDGYSVRVREEIQEEFRIAHRMAKLLFRRQSAAFHLLLKNRTVCRWCVEILTGRKSYRQLRREVSRRGWLLPLQFRPFRRQRVHLELK